MRFKRSYRIGVEHRVPRDLIVREEALMSRRRWRHRALHSLGNTGLAMGANWGRDHEKWFITRQCRRQKVRGLVGHQVRAVFIGIELWRFALADERSIEIDIDIRSDEEICISPSLCSGVIIVILVVLVPKLSHVVSIIATSLEPNWQVIIVHALADDLRISAYGMLDHGKLSILTAY
jgi:hypothetical protein